MTRRSLIAGIAAPAIILPKKAKAWRRGVAGQTYITDTLIHAPPTTGPYAYSPPYGTFTPDQGSFPAAGATYVDPVFGRTIRRLTDNALSAVGGSDIYGKNGWWNADATYFVNSMADLTMKAIHTTTGVLKSLTYPPTLGRVNMQCSPVDADEVLYFSGTSIIRQLISTGATSTLKNFGATMGDLGGSCNWTDRTGRYYLINIGSPSFRVWDRQTDTLFTGAITLAITPGSGYVAMTPDASYVIHVISGVKRRHAIDTGAQTLAASGTTFLTGGTDHAAIVVASDGVLYFVRLNNDNIPSFLERVNVATGAVVNIFTFPSGAYARGDPDHLSGVNDGAMKDWVLCSSDDYYATDDNFGASTPVATWTEMQSEIYMINVLTGALRRLAHHRSREAVTYNHQPRVCAAWGGSGVLKVAWASNYGYNAGGTGYCDIYCMDVPQ